MASIRFRPFSCAGPRDGRSAPRKGPRPANAARRGPFRFYFGSLAVPPSPSARPLLPVTADAPTRTAPPTTPRHRRPRGKRTCSFVIRVLT